MANYCRREVSVSRPDNTWILKPCYEPIQKANSLDWCEGCRKRLPLWPTIDQVSAAIKTAQEAA
jgi:hypothetical protein